MKPILTTARRIARRLVRKLAKPGALWLVEHQLRGSEVRVRHLANPPRMLVPAARKARQRQVELIARRNQIRGW